MKCMLLRWDVCAVLRKFIGRYIPLGISKGLDVSYIIYYNKYLIHSKLLCNIKLFDKTHAENVL